MPRHGDTTFRVTMRQRHWSDSAAATASDLLYGRSQISAATLEHGARQRP